MKCHTWTLSFFVLRASRSFWLWSLLNFITTKSVNCSRSASGSRNPYTCLSGITAINKMDPIWKLADDNIPCSDIFKFYK